MRFDATVQRPRPAGSSRRAQAVTLIRIGAAVAVLVCLSFLADRARSQGTPYQQYPQPMSIPPAPATEYAQTVEPPVGQVAGQSQGEAVDGDDQSSGVSAIFQQIAAGGWLMIPLGICSLVVFSLTLERLIALRRGRVIPRPFVRRFTECVEDGQLSFEEAQQICEEFNCPVAEVFQAAVKRWGRPMMEIEQAVIDAGDRVSDGLTRYLRVFHAISNVAPLIGLLGTVLGMIEAFETMSGGGAVGANLLAAGISTALVTTAGGLFVAIPAYVAYMYFAAVSDRYLNEIDRLCQRVIDCISAEGLESSNRAKKTRRAA
jgi:biopolymer transport protein ExbB